MNFVSLENSKCSAHFELSCHCSENLSPAQIVILLSFVLTWLNDGSDDCNSQARDFSITSHRLLWIWNMKPRSEKLSYFLMGKEIKGAPLAKFSRDIDPRLQIVMTHLLEVFKSLRLVLVLIKFYGFWAKIDQNYFIQHFSFKGKELCQLHCII